MRICLYTESALPMLGGQEFAVDALARRFCQFGHEVVVLAPTPRSPLLARDQDFPYQIVRHPRFVSTWRCVEWYRFWLLRLYRRFPFDILHCHSVYPAGYLGALVRSRLGVCVVIVSHGGDVAPNNNVLKKPNVLYRYVRALTTADALVAISDFTQAAYSRMLPDSRKIFNIPNGVSLDQFEPAFGVADRSDPYFLFLGRLVHRKGVDVLLDALALVPPPSRRRIVIAGDGNERQALQLQAERLGLTRWVCFAGVAVGEQKIQLLRDCIAAVVPSRDWEGLPLVVLESYAAGRPVIATRIPGIQNTVEHGRTGWLIEPERPELLAKVLTEVGADLKNADERGRYSREFARRYDWTVISKEYLDLFGKLIAEKQTAQK